MTPRKSQNTWSISITPATIALAITLIGNLGAFVVNIYVTSYRIEALELAVEEHKNLSAHRGAADRLTRLEAQAEARDRAIRAEIDRIENFQRQIIVELRDQ